MATSGTIQAAIRTGYRIQIVWEVTSQSVAKNTSTVTAKVQLVSTGSSYTINSSASKSGSLTINGTKYSFTFSAALSGNQTKTLYTKTVTISHASDGTKTCSFACSCGINVTLSGTYYGAVTASGSGVFNTIARASSISSVTSSVAVNGTNTVTVAISRKSSAFTHTVVFKFGSYSKTTTDVGTSTSYAIPLTWLNAMPNATSGTATVTVTTYSGSTKIGSAVSKTFKLTVPSTVVPSISSVTLSEGVAGLAAQFGGYVQNKSKLAVKVAASGTYGSTIKAYKTTIDGTNYTSASFTSGTLKNSGTRTITIQVTDSRGRTASVTRSITVLAYSAPKITSFSAFRVNADGVEDYNGTSVKCVYNWTMAAANNKNGNAYFFQYKATSATDWITIASGNEYSFNGDRVFADVALEDSSYDFRLSITDYFTTVRSTTEIPTAFTLLDFNSSGKALAIGKVSELNEGVEIDLPISITKYVYMGGVKKSDEEKDIYFQTSEDATNVHNCKLYGASGDSVTSIGCWDTARAHGIWRYLTDTQNLVFDAKVKVTKGNGGDEFVTSDPVTHGSRTGRVQFSNGLLIQWGVVSITPAANTPTAEAVKFPVSYTSVPMVLTSAITTVPGASVTGDAPADITVTGFNAYVTRTNATNTTVGWVAIGYKEQ